MVPWFQEQETAENPLHWLPPLPCRIVARSRISNASHRNSKRVRSEPGWEHRCNEGGDEIQHFQPASWGESCCIFFGEEYTLQQGHLEAEGKNIVIYCWYISFFIMNPSSIHLSLLSWDRDQKMATTYPAPPLLLQIQATKKSSQILHQTSLVISDLGLPSYNRSHGLSRINACGQRRDNFGPLQTPTTVPHGPGTYFPQRVVENSLCGSGSSMTIHELNILHV